MILKPVVFSRCVSGGATRDFPAHFERSHRSHGSGFCLWSEAGNLSEFMWNSAAGRMATVQSPAGFGMHTKLSTQAGTTRLSRHVQLHLKNRGSSQLHSAACFHQHVQKKRYCRHKHNTNSSRCCYKTDWSTWHAAGNQQKGVILVPFLRQYHLSRIEKYTITSSMHNKY